MSRALEASSIEAITFDAGGTLLAPHPSVGAVYREVALRHGRDYDEARLERCFRRAFRAVAKSYAIPDPEAREREFWSQVALRTVQAAGDPPADFEHFFAELYETFAHGARWRVFPRTEETLAFLVSKKLTLGVVSNWDRRLHTVLEETGLRPYFHTVVISSEVGHEKPHPEIFRVAAHALGVSESRCLHIGDSREHDLDGAHAAGWRSLLVRNDEETCGPFEVNALSDLMGLFR